MIKEKYDVIVVGGGPAGMSTARCCAKHGLDVLVLEKRQEIGAPVRCGEGISKSNINIIEEKLGLRIPERCWRQNIVGAYIYAPNGKCIEIRYPGSNGYILERKAFDKWLAEEAARAGAKIITKADAYDLIKENDAVKGVKVNINGEDRHIKSNIVVAADGVESVIMRKAGISKSKNPSLVDSGFQYQLCNIKLRDSHMIELFLGNEIAPRGYLWVFPKGDDIANVGIGISGAGYKKTAKQYLDEFIAGRPDLAKGSIIETVAGLIPVGGLMENMAGNGILGVGDAVNQLNPIHGGGIAEAIFGGKIAGDVIAEAHKKNDFSLKTLSSYNEIWWKEQGDKLKRIEKVRETFENTNDDQLNDLADVITAEDLTALARGDINKIAAFAKILIKYKMKSLARFLGV